MVIEGMATTIQGSLPVPRTAASAARRYLYVKWTGEGMTELYDYQRDPLELRNVARKDRYHDQRHRMHLRAEELCSPVRPGSPRMS